MKSMGVLFLRLILQGLAIGIIIQIITGVMMMMMYEPSMRSATGAQGKPLVLLEEHHTHHHSIHYEREEQPFAFSPIIFAEIDTNAGLSLLSPNSLQRHARIIHHPITGNPLIPSIAYYTVESAIHHTSDFGWLVRGVHRGATHALALLALLWCACNIVLKRYTAMPFVIWWSGVCGFWAILMASGITGYILPFTIYSLEALEILGSALHSIPLCGSVLEGLFYGAPSVSFQTLPRMYTLHIVILPMAILVSLAFARSNVQQKTQQEAEQTRGIISFRDDIVGIWHIINGKANTAPPSIYSAIIALCMLLWCVVCAGLFFTTSEYPHLPADLTQVPLYQTASKPEWYVYPLYRLLHSVSISAFWGIVLICICCIGLLPLLALWRKNSSSRTLAALKQLWHIVACGIVLLWSIVAGVGAWQQAEQAKLVATEESFEVIGVMIVLSGVLLAGMIVARRVWQKHE